MYTIEDIGYKLVLRCGLAFSTRERLNKGDSDHNRRALVNPYLPYPIELSPPKSMPFPPYPPVLVQEFDKVPQVQSFRVSV